MIGEVNIMMLIIESTRVVYEIAAPCIAQQNDVAK